MKYIHMVLIAFLLCNCEKDDICDSSTSTTPRLIINFYDASNPNDLKNVTDLKIVGEGKSEGITFNNGSTTSNGNSVAIPLKIDTEATTFHFILNYDNLNSNLIKEDKITFYYSKNNLFVSRACGFKTIFELETIPLVHEAVPSTNLKWIQSIVIQNNKIDNENEAHVKIFF